MDRSYLLMKIILFIVIFISLSVPVVLAYSAGPTGLAIDGGSEFWIYSSAQFCGIGGYERIDKIIINAGKFIDAIEVQYTMYNWPGRTGPINRLQRAGGSGGKKFVFDLAKDEYIIQIFGRYGKYIDSLTIVTNKRVSPRYGGNGVGKEFQYTAPNGVEIMGFFGRSGRFINSIGVKYRELFKPCSTRYFYKVPDCNGKCVQITKVIQWLGDGLCDLGGSGIDLNCDLFNSDGGDCPPHKEPR